MEKAAKKRLPKLGLIEQAYPVEELLRLRTELLAKFREACLTQEEFAKEIGISVIILKFFITAKRRPSEDTILKIKKYLMSSSEKVFTLKDIHNEMHALSGVSKDLKQ